MTRWRACPGFKGWYEVSDEGQVRSVARTIMRSNGKPMRLAQRMRATCKSKDGQTQVTLLRAGKLKTLLVGRAVLEAFRPAPAGEWFALHRDGDQQNCRLKNLFWGDREDLRHASRNGRARAEWLRT